MKKIYLFLVLSCLSLAVNAQVASTYGLAISSGTYTPLVTGATGVTTISSGGALADDASSSSISIGFPFIFGGSTTTLSSSTLSICSNGWISLANRGVGSTTPTLSASVSRNNTAANAGTIGTGMLQWFFDDLDGSSGTIRYATTGSAPNRIFIIEFANDKVFGSSALCSVEIKLYETSNIIQYIYSGSFSGGSASIGLSNSSSDYLSVNTSGVTSTSTFTTSWSTNPTTGTIYTFCPAALRPTVAVSGSPSCSPAAFTASGAATFAWLPTTGLSSTNTAATTANPTAVTTYTVTGTAANGCSATATAVANPAPTGITSTLGFAVCVGKAITLVGAPTGGTWSRSNGTGTVNISTAGVITGLTAGTATATYTSATGGCYLTQAITVNPTPTVSIAGAGAYCSGTSSTLTASGTGTSYTWSPSATLSASTGATVFANPTANTTYTALASLGSCTATATAALVYHATPTYMDTSLGGGYVCVPGTTPYTAYSSYPSTYPNFGAYSSSDASIASVDIYGIVTGVAAGTATISFTDAACGYVAMPIRVVNGGFSLNVSPSSPFYCTGGTPAHVVVTGVGATADTFLWSPATAVDSPTYGTVNISPSSTSSYAVYATNNSTGCHAQAYVTVTNNTPVAITGGVTAICAPSTTTWTDATGGGTWSSSNTGVATVSSTGVVTGVSTGIAIITYSMPSTGCFVTRAINVDVTPTTAVSPTTVCGSSTLTATGATNYTWSPNTALSATTGSSVLASPTGPVTYTVVGANGVCTLSATATVTPNMSPITGGSTACAPFTQTLLSQNFNSGLTGAVGGTWTIVNGAGSSSLWFRLLAAPGYSSSVPGDGSQYIEASPDATNTLMVTEFRSPTFATSGMASASLTFNQYYNRYASGDVSASIEYSTNGGTSWTNIVNQFSSGASVGATSWTVGTPTTTIALPAGALNQGSVMLRWYYQSTWGFYWAVDNIVLSGPVGGTIALADATTGGTWSSTAPSVATVNTSGVVTGLAAGTATISYTNTCGSATKPVTILASPGAITGGSVVCTGNVLNLANTAANGTWTSSNTAVASVNATTGVVTGLTAGTTTISYSTGCGTAVGLALTVNTGTSAITGPTTVCGASTISLSNTASGGTWTSSAPGIASVNASTGVVAGISGGNATITYTIGSCYSTQTIAVSAPAAIGGNNYVCIGSQTSLTDVTPSGTWSSSDVSVATVDASGVVSGVSNGTFTITYTVSGCAATKTIQSGNPAAITGPTSVCAPYTQTLLSQNFNTGLTGAVGGTWSIVNGAGTTASWFRLLASPGYNSIVPGDGSQYIEASPDALTTLTVTEFRSPVFSTSSLLSASLTFNQYYNRYASGDVSASIEYSTNGGSTWTNIVNQFSSGASVGATSWTVGTPNTTIALPAGALNQSSVMLRWYYQSTFGFEWAVDNIVLTAPVGGVITLADATAGGTWSTSAPSVATINTSGVVTGLAAGTATISYTNSCGSATQPIAVLGTPASITGTAAACPGNTVTLANATAGGTWSSANSSIATVNPATGAVTGVTSGTVNISYSTGCGTTATISFTVYTSPAAVSPSSAIICPSTSTTLTNSAAGGTWSSANTSIATVNPSTGVVAGVAFGTTTISYANGCGTPATASITVNPTPGTTTASATSLCVGSTATLTNTAAGGTWTSSSSSIATVNSSTGLVTALSGGTFNITYSTSCGTPLATAMTSNAAPASITPLSTVDLCIGLTTTLSNTALGGTWTSSDATVATVNTTTGVVGGVAAGTATITYNNGCGAPVTRDVNVNTPPNSSITGTGAVCQNATVTLANTVAGGTWYSSNTTIATVDAVTGVVGGVAGGTATISYLTTGCNPATRSITVNAVPASITGASLLCPGTSTTLANAVAGGTWSSSNTSVATISAGGVAGATATPGTTTIFYSNGCAPDATLVLTVSGSAAPISGASSLCAPSGGVVLSQNFNTGLTGQIGGTWSIVNGAGSASVWFSLRAAPGYNSVVPGDGSQYMEASPDAVNALTVTEFRSPTFSTLGVAALNIAFNQYYNRYTADVNASIEYSTNGGSTWTTIVNQFSGGAGVGTTSWTVGTPTTTLAMPAGALGQSSVMLRWYYQSTWGFEWAVDNIVVSSPAVNPIITLTDATPGGTWASSNTGIVTVNASGVVASVAVGTATITYTAACGSPVTTPVTVNPNPGAITGTFTLCQGTSVTLANPAGAGTWTSGNTAVASVNTSTGVVTGISGGTSLITFSNGCGSAVTQLVTITPVPGTITGSLSLCPGGAGTLADAVTGGTWSSSAPSIVSINASTGAVTAVGAAGTSAVITYSNGCSPAATATLTIASTPSPITGTTTLCAPIPGISTILSQNWNTGLTGQIGGAWSIVNGAGSSAVWFRLLTAPGYNSVVPGDGSQYIEASPDAVNALTVTEFRSPSFSTIGLASGSIAFNQYYNRYTADVNASIEYSTNGGSTWTTIVNQFSGGVAVGTTSWTVGTPTTTLSLPAGALSQSNVMLRWYYNSTWGFEWAVDNIVVSGVSSPNTVLADATPGGTWSSSNTSVATVASNGTVVSVAAGTTNISYTTSCGAVGTVVTVNPAPGSITGASAVCAGSSLSLSNSVSGGTWTSSNTAVASVNSSTGVVTGVGAGTASITYTTACGSPTPFAITVTGLPATITGPSALCPSSTGTLANATTGGVWSSSNTSVISINSSTGVMTSGVTAGTSATITYSNGCAPAATTVVSINGTTSPITGVFTLCSPYSTTLLAQDFNSGLTGQVGGTWSIVNTSTVSATAYFQLRASPGYNSAAAGDGSQYMEAAPDAGGSGTTTTTEVRSPSFSTVGTASANLAFNQYYVYYNADINASVEYSINGGTTWVTMVNQYGGGVSVGNTTWVAGTPTTTIPLPAGALGQPNVMVRFYYNSVWGLYWAIDNVTLIAPATSTSTILADATPSGTWSTSNAAIVTVNSASGLTSSVSAGTATITYTGPCGAPVTQPILVNGVPGVIGGAGSICIGTSVSLTNTATGGTWTSSNSAVASVNASTGVITALSAGTTTVTFANGCGSATTATVTVKSAPAAIGGATSICPSSTTFLANSVTGGTWTSSNTSVASINTFSGSLTSTATPGTTTITYSNGCTPDVTSVVTVSSFTDTIVGLSAICASPSSLLATSFESGVPSSAASPVDGWSYVQGTGSANNYWISATGAATSNPTSGTPSGGGAKVVQFSSNTIASGNTAAIVSPSFDLTGGNGGRVSFYFYRDATAGVASNYDSVAVYANTTPAVGGSWIGSVCRSTTRATAYTGTAVATGWYKYTYNIPASFAGSSNYIIIKGYSAAGNNMYMDSLSIRNNSAMATLTDATSGGTWSSSVPSVATVNGVGVVTALSAGTTTISYTGACGTPVTHPVTVNPTPGANTNGATTICVGATTTVANALAGGTWSSVNPAIATVDALGNVTGLSAGTATISYFNGCGSAATTSIIVNALPTVASVTASSASLCAGAPLTLTAGTVSGAGGLTSYNWSGPAAFSTTGTAIFNTHTVASSSATGVYSLTVTYPGLGCTSANAVTGTVTVNDYPTTYNVTGGNGCSAGGITVGLDGSQSSAVSYLLRLLPSTTVSTVAGTSTTLSFAPVTTSGAYVVVATGPGGCQILMNGSDTITMTPAITVGTSPSICQPTTSASVSFTLPVGSPVTYNLDWSAAANTAGFTDVAGNMLSGSSITLVIPASGAVGSFTGDITVSNGVCTSAPYTTGVTVYATPIVPVITVTNPCVNYVGGVTLTGVNGSVVDYTVDGGSVNTFTFAGTSHTISTGNITTPHIYTIINAHNPVCTTPINDSVMVTPVPMAWLGGAPGRESDWNDSSNWTCGFPPSVSDDASISSTIYAPAIPASISVNVNDLTLNSPSLIMLNAGSVLNVKGNVLNTSTISGNGKVILSGAVQQLVKGIGTISNLELNNASGAKVDTASRLMISNALTITSGVLNTSDSLELLSLDTAATARIAPLPTSSSIVGRVKTDQYVQGGFRRYRLWSHSFSDTMSLQQIQKFIDITGTGGSVNGFVPTSSNAPSAFRYDPLVGNSSLSYDTGWRAITKINAGAGDDNMLHPGQGLRLFVRGLKGEGLGYAGYYGTYNPSPSTIKMMGHVNQGPVSIRLAKGTVDPTNQDYNLVGNPYPSPIDIGTIAANALASNQITGGAFYLWIASTPGGGQWNIVPIGSPYYIGAHVGFEVHADHDGATLDFVESNKASSVDNYLFKAPAEYTTLSVYDSNNEMWDMLRINFTDAAHDNEDRTLDATKPTGTNFGFYSMSPDGRKLGIDARPYGADKVIPLGVQSTYQQDFVIRANNIAVPHGGSVYLHDKLLGKVTEMKAGSEYKFTIGKDKATQGDDRFELSMKPAVAATAKGLSVNMTPNPATDDVKINFTSGKKEAVSVRVLDMSGVSIYSQDLGVQQNGTVSVPLSSFAAGIYMVELTQGTQKVTQKLVKE